MAYEGPTGPQDVPAYLLYDLGFMDADGNFYETWDLGYPESMHRLANTPMGMNVLVKYDDAERTG